MNTTEHDWFFEQMATYLADGLDAGERARFEAHAAACAPCAGQLAEFRNMETTMTDLLSPANPGADFGQHMIERLRMNITARRRWIHPKVVRVATATAAAIMLGATGYLGQQFVRDGQLPTFPSLGGDHFQLSAVVDKVKGMFGGTSDTQSLSGISREPVNRIGQDDASSQVVMAQLERRLPEVRFDNVGLGDVVDFMRDVSGAQIEVDWKKLESEGVTRDTQVNTRLKDVKFSSALESIAKSADGGTGKVLDAIKIGPGNGGSGPISPYSDILKYPDNWPDSSSPRSSGVTEVYDVRDLIDNVSDFDQPPQFQLQNTRGGIGAGDRDYKAPAPYFAGAGKARAADDLWSQVGTVGVQNNALAYTQLGALTTSVPSFGDFGNGGITKTGSGTWTSGGTSAANFGNGTVVLSRSTSLGTGSVSIDGGALRFLDRGSDKTVNGIVGGTGMSGTFAGQIAGGGLHQLTKEGTSAWRLNTRDGGTQTTNSITGSADARGVSVVVTGDGTAMTKIKEIIKGIDSQHADAPLAIGNEGIAGSVGSGQVTNGPPLTYNRSSVFVPDGGTMLLGGQVIDAKSQSEQYFKPGEAAGYQVAQRGDETDIAGTIVSRTGAGPTGSVYHTGTGAVTLDDGNKYTGVTVVTGGTLESVQAGGGMTVTAGTARTRTSVEGAGPAVAPDTDADNRQTVRRDFANATDAAQTINNLYAQAGTTQPAGGGGGAAVVQQAAPAATIRKVIREGVMEFEVDSFDSTFARISLITGEEGGFVVAADSNKLPNGKVRGTITVRVPPDRLDTLVLKLRALGDLKSQRLGSRDVGKQYTDLQSELRAARAMENRLLELIANAQGEVKDLLEAEKELGNWRTRIEKIVGEMNYYDNLVSMATLTVTAAEKDIRSPASTDQTETINMGVELSDVEGARTSATKLITDARGRIVESTLQKLEAGQLTARIVADVDPESADVVLDQLKLLGNVVRLDRQKKQTTQGTPGPAPVGVQPKIEQSPTRFSVEMHNLANVQPRLMNNLNIAAEDVEAAYRAILARIAEAGGRVIKSNLNRQDATQAIGSMQFDVPAAEADALTNDIRTAAGRQVLQLTVTENPDTANVTSAKQAFTVQIVPAVQVPPRETRSLRVHTGDVQAAVQALTAAVNSANGRVADSRMAQDTSGRAAAQLTIEVPLRQANAMSDTIRGLGNVRSAESARNNQIPEGVLSRAQFQVIIETSERLVPAEGGLWTSIRGGLSTSMQGLMFSLQLIIIGLCLVAPWALALWIGWKWFRKGRKSQPPSAPVTSA